jgi:hypothetical protein
VAVNGRYVYWANYGSGTIARANLDGANVEKRFITGADEPIGIAVDSGHVYWTNAGLDPGSGTIGRANLDGSRVNQHFTRRATRPAGSRSIQAMSTGPIATGTTTTQASAMRSGAPTSTARTSRGISSMLRTSSTALP